jgi:hypothetical protein
MRAVRSGGRSWKAQFGKKAPQTLVSVKDHRNGSPTSGGTAAPHVYAPGRERRSAGSGRLA